jgi:hypothetical protein
VSSPSKGSTRSRADRRGTRPYRGDLTGERLERCRGGLPEWFDANIDSLCLDALANGDVASFGTRGGRLFASADEGRTWSEIASGLPPINCVLTSP